MDMTRRVLRIFIVVIAFPVANLAAADIYKCQAADGSIAFSDVECADGATEPVTLKMNSALDSSVARSNISAYRERGVRQQGPQILFIDDTRTEERNARITAQEQRATGRRHARGKVAKRKNKRKRSSRQKAVAA